MNKFLKEAQEFDLRFNPKLLEGIDRWSRWQTTVLLEGQRLLNELNTKDLEIAESTICPKCSGKLEENPPYYVEENDPIRFKCSECKWFFQMKR